VFTAAYKEEFMKRLFVFALLALTAVASAHAQNRLRGTITAMDGDLMTIKSRDGRDLQIRLAPDVQVAVPKRASADDFKQGAFVGVTSVKGPDGRLVARRVHALGPTTPSGHIANWDGMPNSLMTNGNIESRAQMSGGDEIVLKYKDGEQKILATPQTEYYTFTNGSRADLKPGEQIFTGAKPDGSKFVTGRVVVSKDGVNPPQ
jgi:hypothetical protein